ncbi:MAG: element excision factor XisH family protein [Cyanobacteria bacterium P01_E01_bin.42]
MPTRDKFHQLVRTSLETEGWTITHDPYHIDLGLVDFYIDLGAELVLAAMKDREKIAVEIKTFLAPSTITDFHTALGQFINYRIALEDNDPERSLYLAIPTEIYQRFFQQSFIQKFIRKNELYLLVYNTEKKENLQWIK